ncbi:MAG: glycosyltransferase [Clostridia bacterium]|nr:glycosyltransferase [Clostridia bacterium]
MKILYINCVCGVGSTGRIVTDLMRQMKAQGHTVKVACATVEPVKNADPKDVILVGSRLDYYIHNALSRITDHEGLYSKAATRRLIQKIREYDPDLVHLHNLHGHWINYEMLFQYLAEENKKVLWTLHDCWAFTGHCSHCSLVKCDKWKTKCRECPGLSVYPKCWTKGDVERNFERKKRAFTSVGNLKIITPSNWLASLVKESFLGKYEIEAIHNRVDPAVFKPTPGDFRERYGLTDKIIVLGVSSIWNEHKGYDDFCKLAERLDERYVVVLVGLTEKQIGKLPSNMVGIKRTYNLQELAEIYTAADYYINASKAETFGMTTLEAALCGKKPIVYKGTAGEEIVVEYGGEAVEQSVEALIAAVTKRP